MKEIIDTDNVAKEALEEGLLNLSAYARKIKPRVDERLWKQVHVGAIVTALSRLPQTKEAPLVPKLILKDLTVQTGIIEYIFENSTEAHETIAAIRPTARRGDFFVVMQGLNEIALLCKQHEVSTPSLFTIQTLKDLAAVTIRLDDTVIEQPNIFYALMKPLIAQRINIVEIVTGLGEITFVVHTKDQQKTFEAMQSLKG